MNIDQEFKEAQERLSRSIGQYARHAKADIKLMADAARAEIDRRHFIRERVKESKQAAIEARYVMPDELDRRTANMLSRNEINEALLLGFI